MNNFHLPEYLEHRYQELKDSIKKHLAGFQSVPVSDFFYELCYCICTPQSKAANALIVSEYLKANDFFNIPFVIATLLRDPKNYIRFHNTKAKRIFEARDKFDNVLHILNSDKSPVQKRINLNLLINGIGFKESSHFLRNIGYTNLAILDRHILKILIECNVLNEVPKSISINKYLEIENKFLALAEKINIPIDELDILFWSYKTGTIGK